MEHSKSQEEIINKLYDYFQKVIEKNSIRHKDVVGNRKTDELVNLVTVAFNENIIVPLFASELDNNINLKNFLQRCYELAYRKALEG